MLLKLPHSVPWRRLFLAFTASSFGDQFTRVALLPKVGATGGDLTWLVGIALAQAIPAMVVSPFAGHLADRGTRKAYLVLADVARALLLCWIAFAGSLQLIVAGTAAIAACNSIFRPVEASLEADILTPEDVMRANVARSAMVQLLMVCGPAVAGLMLIWLPASKVLLIDALSFAASAVAIATLSTDGVSRLKKPEEGGQKESRGDIRKVIRFIAARTDLQILFLTAGLVTALLSIQNPLFYGFVQQTLLKGGAIYGLFMTALGTGGFLASLLMGRHRGPVTIALLLGTLLFDGLALVAFTCSGSIALATLLMAALGAIGAVFAIAVRAYLQLNVLAELRGRVIGWFMGLQAPIAAASLTVGLYIALLVPAWLVLRISGVAEVLVAAMLLAGALLSHKRRSRQPESKRLRVTLTD